jgi:hypothetical protein
LLLIFLLLGPLLLLLLCLLFVALQLLHLLFGQVVEVLVLQETQFLSEEEM